MKKIKKLSIKALVLLLMFGVFIPSQAGTGEKSGGIYHYDAMDSEGNWAHYSISTCDPCGWFGRVFGCHCVGATGKHLAE